MPTKTDVIRLIKIGNSSGIIIKKKLLQQAGIEQNTDLQVYVEDGKIIIRSVKFKSSKVKPLNKV